MKKAGLLVLMLALAAGVAEAADERSELKVRSLLHTAQDLYQTPQARARAGRLVAMAEYIHSLKTTDLVAMRFMYEVDAFRGDKKDARTAAQNIFDAQPDNYFAAMRWLDSQVEKLQTAPARMEFLEAIVQSSKHTATVRSQAAVKLYNVLKGRGDNKKAAGVMEHAIKLDPMNADALALRLLSDKKPSDELKAETYLGLIRSNPLNVQTQWLMGKLLSEVGLPKEAMKFYTAAWKVESGGKNISQMSGSLVVDYLNAMLSSGQAKQAWDTFSSQRQRLAKEPLFQALMIEAAKLSNQDQGTVVAMISALRKYYFGAITDANMAEGLRLTGPTQKKNAPASAKARMELAAFYLVEQDSPKQALSELADARLNGAKGDIADLIENAAKLRNGDAKALDAMKKLSGKYAMASVFLADYYMRAKNTKDASEVVKNGLSLGRGSRAARALMKISAELKLDVPPFKDSAQIAAMVNGFDPQIFNLAAEPQNYIGLSVKPKAAMVTVREPIYVDVTLTNKGQLPISLGNGGMLKREIALVIATQKDIKSPFMANPLVFLPAGRYLKPGQSVTGWTRIDTGHVDWYLTANPLGNVVLNVKAVINPKKKDGKLTSAIPQIKTADMTVCRKGLLATGKPVNGVPAVEMTTLSYNKAVAEIQNKLAAGSLKEKMAAARQIGGLITFTRMVELKEQTVSAELAKMLNISGAVDLLKLALANKDDIVRGEAIASMQYVTMGPELMNAFGAVMEDPAVYVRFRLVELLGNIGGSGNMAIMPMFIKDKNKYVSMMAKAFIHYQNVQDKKTARKTKK